MKSEFVRLWSDLKH